MKTNKQFMKIALKQAYKGIKKNIGGPFGAVIVKDGKIISKASNTVLKSKCAVNHAEINAIIKASEKLQTHDLSGCVIYTTSKPCPMCLNAIKWANITKIYYGTSSEDVEKIGFRDKKFYEDGQTLKLKQIMKKDSLVLLKSWNTKEDKVIY